MGCGPLDYYFPEPLVVALKGSSFVKVNGEWVLRHACFKSLRCFEIAIEETISYAELQKMGKESQVWNQEKKQILSQHLLTLDSKSYKPGNFSPKNQIKIDQHFLFLQDCIYLMSNKNITILKGRVFSLDALFRGTGWLCDLQCQKSDSRHKVGVIFVDQKNWPKMSLFIDKNMGRVNCKASKNLYIVNEKWLERKLNWISSQFILEMCNPLL